MPKANALAFRIDRQHHGFDRADPSGSYAHGFFAGDVPRDVGQMHETIDVAREANENTEVGDRLDLAADLVPTVEVLSRTLSMG